MHKPLILIVEDDAPIRNLIATTLKANDYRFITALTGESAVAETATHNPDIILLDLGLPDLDGIEVIKQIRYGSKLSDGITPLSFTDALKHIRYAFFIYLMLLGNTLGV